MVVIEEGGVESGLGRLVVGVVLDFLVVEIEAENKLGRAAAALLLLAVDGLM